jgi:hypothetical protein
MSAGRPTASPDKSGQLVPDFASAPAKPTSDANLRVPLVSGADLRASCPGLRAEPKWQRERARRHSVAGEHGVEFRKMTLTPGVSGREKNCFGGSGRSVPTAGFPFWKRGPTNRRVIPNSAWRALLAMSTATVASPTLRRNMLGELRFCCAAQRVSPACREAACGGGGKAAQTAHFCLPTTGARD